MSKKTKDIPPKSKIEKLKEALIWCSGSDDFQVGGKARKGWLKLCVPLLREKQKSGAKK